MAIRFELRFAGTRRIGQRVEPVLDESLSPFGYASGSGVQPRRDLFDGLSLMRKQNDLGSFGQAMLAAAFAGPTAQYDLFLFGQPDDCGN